MKWGLIARAESDRGLGVLTGEMHRHLQPDRTLVGTLDSGYEQRLDQYPDATVMSFDNGTLDETQFKEWCTGLDVIVSAETFYDWRTITWARQLGTRTILYAMPELLKHEIGHTLPTPDAFWYPTSWRLDKMPPGVVLPVPVESRPFEQPPTDTIRMVHVAGKKALAIRNGTDTLINALPAVRGDSTMTVFSQDNTYRLRSGIPAHVVKGPPDKWDMYSDAHVLVMPRKYGGLCLPVLEALSCGLAVVMTDVSPNSDWPIIPVKAENSRVVQMPCGPVHTHVCNQLDLAHTLTGLSVKRDIVERAMERSRQWAEENTWERRSSDFLAALSG